MPPTETSRSPRSAAATLIVASLLWSVGPSVAGMGLGVGLVHAPKSEAASAPLPLDAQGWYARAMELLERRDKPAALEAFDRSVALDPGNALAWANRGTTLLNLGRYDEALASYERALAIRRDDPYVYCSQATVYNRTGRPDDALAATEKALEVDPGFVWARFNMARALRALGREAEADAVLAEAFRQRPDLRADPSDGR